jgi:hypothetical protein
MASDIPGRLLAKTGRSDSAYRAQNEAKYERNDSAEPDNVHLARVVAAAGLGQAAADQIADGQQGD